jgi:hypothetical protein
MACPNLPKLVITLMLHVEQNLNMPKTRRKAKTPKAQFHEQPGRKTRSKTIPSSRVESSGQVRQDLTKSCHTRQGVYLRIARSFIHPFHPPSPNLPTGLLGNDPNAVGHLYLIVGSRQDISRYSGLSADWLAKIAKFICEPRQDGGQLYTHTTGTVDQWYDQDRTANWAVVAPGNVLEERIYEFVPSGPVLLTQYSDRHQSSRTQDAHLASSSTFRTQLQSRDAGCVVTRYNLSVIASHLIPKRMGAAGASSMVSRFAGPHAAAGIHEFDATIGIMLLSTLDSLSDMYLMGFYHLQASHCISCYIH